MNGEPRSKEQLGKLAATVRYRSLPVLFGDRVGLALFLGVLVVLALVWRVGFFITDTYAIANTLVNVAEGHFHITHIEYSLTLGSQPGLYQHGNRVFGRNYGQAIFAVPFYWLLEGGAAIAELRLVLAGIWSLLAAAFASQLARILDRPRVALFGTVLAFVAFTANVMLSTPLEARWTGLLALQLLTLVAAGIVAVTLYRLLAGFHDRRVGVAAGTLAALSLPIAFWATIPKRHVLSAALIAVVVLAFAKSRRGSLATRALAYVAVGLFAWLHAAEALAVFVVFVPLDLVTAPRNGPRELAGIALAFGLALLPFAATNVAITGSPFVTPRMLPSLGDAAEIGPEGQVIVSGGNAGSEVLSDPPDSGVSLEPTAGENGGRGALPSPDALLDGILALVTTGSGIIAARIDQLFGYTLQGGNIALQEPDRLVDVFVRSGRIPGVRYRINDHEVIELAVFETAPVLGMILATPFVLGKRIVCAGQEAIEAFSRGIRTTPRYQTDLLVTGIVVVFVLLYLPRLPLFSQITVRYLVPTMPLVLYGVFRLPAVRNGFEVDRGVFWQAYISASAVGAVAIPLLLMWIDPAIGEAIQFHAMVNLVVAAIATIIVIASTVFDRGARVAVAVGTAGGAGTALFGLAGLEYFTYAEFVLPIARWLSTLLGVF